MALRKNIFVKFRVKGDASDWDMSEKEYKKLLKYDGKIAKIISNKITYGNYYVIQFGDKFEIEADLTDFEIKKITRTG